MQASVGQVYVFGPFQLDPARRVLASQGRPVRLTAKVFDLLLLLVRNQERALSRTELLEFLWPDTVVEEGNLSVSMSALRKALAGAGSEQRYIETLPRLGYRFVGEAREQRASAPLRVELDAESRVGDPAERALDVARQTPFVGRVAELGRLHELLAQAWGGTAAAVFVHGEPGIGKTTLAQRFMEEVARRPEPALVATGRCLQQHGAGEAYLPFLDGFSSMLAGPHATLVRRVLQEHAPAWCRHFPEAAVSQGESDPLREAAPGGFERLLREARAALGALSRELPVLFLLEDLHWADPSSIDLLSGLIAGAGAERQLLIATFRLVEVEARKHPLEALLRELRIHQRSEELALAPLSDSAIEQYLAERFQRSQLPAELTRLVENKTEGHPLLLNRVVQWLVDRGDLSETEDGWGLTCPIATLARDVPQSIESMILGRLDLLTSEEQRTLTYASVEGGEFNSTVLAALLGVDEIELEERLNRLEKVHRLIERLSEDQWPSGALVTRYRFGHALYCEFLYQRIVPRRRRQLHGNVALTFVKHFGDHARELGARLALHFEQAGEILEAIENLGHAGQNAKALYAYREAETHFSRALGLIELLPSAEQPRCRLDMHRERGWIRFQVEQYAASTQDFDQMLAYARSLGDLAAQSDAGIGHWRIATCVGQAARCKSEAQNLLWLAQEMDDDLRKAGALGMLGAQEFSLLGDLALARRHLDDAISLTRSAEHLPNGASALRARAPVLHTRACLRELQSDYDGAASDNLEALGDLAESPILQVSNLFDRGRCRAHLGQIELALSDFRTSSELAKRAGCQYFLGRIENSVAWVHRELEDSEEARRRDEAALELGHQHRDAFSRLHALLNLAAAHARSGDQGSARAQVLLADAEQLADTQEFGCNRHKVHLRVLIVRCEVLQCQADLSTATAVALEALALATSKGARKYIALAHWQIGQAHSRRGAITEAAASLRAALSALRERPCPLLAWRVYAALGEVNLDLAKESARSDFTRAREVIDAIASNLGSGQLKDTFLGSARVARVHALTL